jgi:glucose-6-phosphate dehydrogenase-like protein
VTATEVLARLRRSPVLGTNNRHPPNYLRFVLSPDISISLGATVKAPGEAMKGTDVELALHEQPRSAELGPYERLLGDALDGDASLFAREDSVEAAWAVVGPVLGDTVPLRRYQPGTWGPEQARDLMAAHGGWHDPNPRAGKDVTPRRPVGRSRLSASLDRLRYRGGHRPRRRHGAITCPLPTTVTPPGDTVSPRARSCSLSTPTVAPSRTTTFLSRMARSTTA